jgi:hypothetical protein
MFERRHHPLLPPDRFLRRMASSLAVTGLIIGVSLGIGTVGYMMFAGLGVIDALLNASMILTGMGPVDRMETVAGKLFAVFYSLDCGIAFLSACGVLTAPVFHRPLHHFHAVADESA